MAVENANYSGYRWVMFGLAVIVVLGQTFVWLSPAPLLTTIIEDLKIDLGAAGRLLTIVMILSAFFTFGGSLVIDRLGIKWTMVVSFLVMGFGGVLSFFAQTYAFILTARIIVGIGFGIGMPVAGAMVMEWFPPKEQSYINTFISALANVGMVLAFMIIIPIFTLVKTWQNTLAAFGFYAALVALLWIILGKTSGRAAGHGHSGPDKGALNGELVKKESGLRQAAKRKEVWLLVITQAGIMWTFSTFTTFLPAYFETVRGYEKAAASSLTGFLPLIGILGGLAGGFGTSALGLRKPFSWPLMILILLGTIGSLSIPSGPLLYLSVGLIGFGAACWLPAMMTIPMELEKATMEMVGGSFALIFGLGNFAAYLVAEAFGLLNPKLGIFMTMLLFGFIMIFPIIALIALPETGPRAKRKKEAEA